MRYVFIFLAILALSACTPQGNDAQPAANSRSTTQTSGVPAGAYSLDTAHTSLIFRVSHLGFSNYTGRFSSIAAQLRFDPENLAASSVVVSIDPRSLALENPPPGFVDELLGTQWLDAVQFPHMTFRSTRVEVTAPNNVHITGDLTLHGVTRPVTLDAVFNGGYAGHPMEPHARIGFSAQGTFKRSEFGVASGIPAPGSTMGVSNEVDVVIEAEFTGPPLVAGKSSTE
jgi:polyisoprenoid-binding protein YceI